MGNVVETLTFHVGAFVVRQQPRFDSPGWAMYVVYLGERLIGRSFSRPDEGWCAHLLRSANESVEYVSTERPKYKLRGVALTRKRHNWLPPE